MLAHLVAVILGRAPRPLIKPQVRRRDPDLLRDERDSLVRQLRAARREPPMPGTELNDQGEADSRRPALARGPCPAHHPAGSSARPARPGPPAPPRFPGIRR